MEPSAHPPPDWCTRSYSCWHAVGGLPHGHTPHPASKVRQRLQFHSTFSLCNHTSRLLNVTALVEIIGHRCFYCSWFKWMNLGNLHTRWFIAPVSHILARFVCVCVHINVSGISHGPLLSKTALAEGNVWLVGWWFDPQLGRWGSSLSTILQLVPV